MGFPENWPRTVMLRWFLGQFEETSKTELGIGRVWWADKDPGSRMAAMLKSLHHFGVFCREKWENVDDVHGGIHPQILQLKQQLWARMTFAGNFATNHGRCGDAQTYRRSSWKMSLKKQFWSAVSHHHHLCSWHHKQLQIVEQFFPIPTAGPSFLGHPFWHGLAPVSPRPSGTSSICVKGKTSDTWQGLERVTFLTPLIKS